MPENDCPTCNDHSPRGEPVRGQEDVWAYTMPVAPDSAITAWPDALGETTQLAANAHMALLEGIPQAPPERNLAAAQSSSNSTMASLDSARSPLPTTQPNFHDTMLSTTAVVYVEYLPQLGAPWFHSDLAMTAEDEPNGDQDADTEPKRPLPEELKDYDKPDEVPRVPNTRVDKSKAGVAFRSKDPPIVAGGDRHEAGFELAWRQAKQLPKETDWELDCPSAKLKYKIGLFWRESEGVGTANSTKGAVDMAEGAVDGVDVDKEIEDNITAGLLETQVKDYLLVAMRWKCPDGCELVVEITDREYAVTVEASWEPIKVGPDTKFKVTLHRSHTLRAVILVYCKVK